MALISECRQLCAQTVLTPPTLLEKAMLRQLSYRGDPAGECLSRLLNDLDQIPFRIADLKIMNALPILRDCPTSTPRATILFKTSAFVHLIFVKRLFAARVLG